MKLKFLRMKNRLLLFLTSICILLLGSGFYSLSNAKTDIAIYNPKDSVYTSVDKVPVFKKRSGNIQKYLSKEIRYPLDALAKGIEGKVMVSFVITAGGKLVNPIVIEGLSESIDKEAIRVVSLLDAWKPGVVEGKDVDTKMIIPVHFYLSEENRKLSQQLKPFYEEGMQPPLFVLDKKKVTGLSVVEYYNIKSIRVIKGQKALDLYGEEGRNGVVVVETKRGTDPIYQRY